MCVLLYPVDQFHTGQYSNNSWPPSSDGGLGFDWAIKFLILNYSGVGYGMVMSSVGLPPNEMLYPKTETLNFFCHIRPENL